MLKRFLRRAYGEVFKMKTCYFIAFFAASAFLFAGAASASSLSAAAREETAAFMFGSKKTVFAVFFALFSKRALSGGAQCLFGAYIWALPLSLAAMLFNELTFSLAWSSLLSGFTVFLYPLIALPGTVIALCSSRCMAHILKNAARQIREADIPKTGRDIFFGSREVFSAFLSALPFYICATAAEALAAAFLIKA